MRPDLDGSGVKSVLITADRLRGIRKSTRRVRSTAPYDGLRKEEEPSWKRNRAGN